MNIHHIWGEAPCLSSGLILYAVSNSAPPFSEHIQCISIRQRSLCGVEHIKGTSRVWTLLFCWIFGNNYSFTALHVRRCIIQLPKFWRGRGISLPIIICGVSYIQVWLSQYPSTSALPSLPLPSLPLPLWIATPPDWPENPPEKAPERVPVHRM